MAIESRILPSWTPDSAPGWLLRLFTNQVLKAELADAAQPACMSDEQATAGIKGGSMSSVGGKRETTRCVSCQ